MAYITMAISRHFLGTLFLEMVIFLYQSLHEKCPNMEFSWSVFSCIQIDYGGSRSKSLYLARIQENTDQKKLRIWALFMQ